MLEKILENIGLTAKEAKIYLATLEIGSNPVSKIASKAKINRVTTYDILEKLSKKGFISSFTRARVKFFTALEPEKLVTEYQKRIAELENSLPNLKALNTEISSPKVTTFEGIEGIKQIYADSLTSKSSIRNFCDVTEVTKHWPTYQQDYVSQRVQKNIFLKGIILDDESGRTAKSSDQYNHRELRLISKEKYNFTSEIMIYDNKVAIITFGSEMIGLLIESPGVAKTHGSLFNLMWNKLEPLMQATETYTRKSATIQPKPVQKTTNGTEPSPENATPQESKASVLENQESLF